MKGRAQVDALIEDVRFLIDNGETDPHRIATRTGTTVSAIARTLYRHGERDLARPFVRAESAERQARQGAA